MLGDWIKAAQSNGAGDGNMRPATPTPAYVFPQGTYDNGPLIRAPHVRPVLFVSDPQAPAILAALYALQFNSYWNEAAAEYGIGSLVIEAPLIVAPPLSATVSTKSLGSWVNNYLKAYDWSLDENTLYAVYYPENVTVHRSTDGATGCVDFAAFHSQFSVATNGVTKNYGYAVMPRCGQNFSLDEMMISSTHEIFEWATDPFPGFARPGSTSYLRLDDAHFAFQLFAGGGELTDFCPGLSAGSEWVRPDGLGFKVARHLSNRESAAGRYPCGPGETIPFLVGIPNPTATDTLKHGREVSAPVVEVPSGASQATTEVFIHSDVAMKASSCWDLDVLSHGVVKESSASSNIANVYSSVDTTADTGIDVSVDSDCVRPGDLVGLKIRKTKTVSEDTRVVLRMRTKSGSMWNTWPFIVTVRR